MKERARQAALIHRASQDDLDAFSALVREYQDMAVGYAVSQLGDFHAAEDAAQEAFVTVFLKLRELRDPVAFPAWFRSIVRTACTRLSRRTRLRTIPLNEEGEREVMAPLREPVGEGDKTDELMTALRSLPEAERAVIALHYTSRFTHREIAQFLDIPETTVQGRLRTGREQLKERMLKMAENNLRQQAPSRDSRFGDRVKRMVRPEVLKSKEEQQWEGGRGTDVWEMLTAAMRGDLAMVKKLVKRDPRLVSCSHQYRSPLHFAVQENQIEVAQFLLEQGADATYASGNYWHVQPLTIAEERGFTELHSLLKRHLAEGAGVSEEGERIAEAIRDRDVVKVGEMLEAEPELIEEDSELVGEVLELALRKFDAPMKRVVRLCLDRDPTAAKRIHANELIYILHRLCAEEEEEMREVLGWLLETGMTPNDSDWLRVTSMHRLAIGSIPHGSDGKHLPAASRGDAAIHRGGGGSRRQG